MSGPDMHDLAKRLARGEEAAFAELYDACADRMYRYLLLRVGSRETAGDLLQTAFLRAVKNRRRFGKVENPVAYLFQIARNEAARMWQGRRRERNVKSLERADVENLTEITSGDDQEAIAAALARLALADREIVELKTYGGLTFQEISQLLSMPLGTVATRYRRALEALRGPLSKELR
jgi:RNA polymerase sigma-70 factor (ECF subfamily)